MKDAEQIHISTQTGNYTIFLYTPQRLPDGCWEGKWSITKQGQQVAGGTTVCCFTASEVLWHAEIAVQKALKSST